MNEASFAACAALVRRSDPDRYYSALAAPADKRPLLHAVYALNNELSRIAESVRQPMLGEIRLQWWRDALEGARNADPPRHDVAEAMATVFSVVDVPQALFDRMIDARAFDVSEEEFPDYAALENYLDATSGGLMRIAAHILGAAADRFDLTVSHAGISFGLVGVARSLAFHAQRSKTFVPSSVLAAHGLEREDLFGTARHADLAAIARELSARASERYRGAHFRAGEDLPLAALLPAALVPLYVRRVERPHFDPANPEVALHNRLAVLLAATLRGRI